MEKIRVCVGSDDTSTVAASHMGDARYFCGYDVFADGKEPVFVEERPNTTGEGTRHADREKMRRVLDIVGDADVLLARRKSPNFRAIAKTTAYQPVVVSTDAIGDALRLVQQRFAEIETYVMQKSPGGSDGEGSGSCSSWPMKITPWQFDDGETPALGDCLTTIAPESTAGATHSIGAGRDGTAPGPRVWHRRARRPALQPAGPRDHGHAPRRHRACLARRPYNRGGHRRHGAGRGRGRGRRQVKRETPVSDSPGAERMTRRVLHTRGPHTPGVARASSAARRPQSAPVGPARSTDARHEARQMRDTKEELMSGTEAKPVGGPIVVAVSSDVIGRGDDQLGQVLIRSFLHTLGEVTPAPDTVIFFNAGVKLAVDGSPVLDELHALEARGVKILLCGTCLGHFELKDRVAAGEISNMYAIAETMLGAARVVNL